jgi:hypothetical protein
MIWIGQEKDSAEFTPFADRAGIHLIAYVINMLCADPLNDMFPIRRVQSDSLHDGLEMIQVPSIDMMNSSKLMRDHPIILSYNWSHKL